MHVPNNFRTGFKLGVSLKSRKAKVSFQVGCALPLLASGAAVSYFLRNTLSTPSDFLFALENSNQAYAAFNRSNELASIYGLSCGNYSRNTYFI